MYIFLFDVIVSIPSVLPAFNKLNEAIELSKNSIFEIIWRPYQLNPNMPIGGINRDEYLKLKFGSKNQASTVYKRIEDEGKLTNINFQFAKIKITPNSFLSHKLLAFAYNRKKQSEVLESLFYHYFILSLNR